MRATKSTSRLEVAFRKLLWRRGLRYRLESALPGRPDMTFPAPRVVVFVHGCYWHRCPKCNLPMPKANRVFWTDKLRRNVERDVESAVALQQQGWTVVTVWECEIRTDPDAMVARVVDELHARGGSGRHVSGV